MNRTKSSHSHQLASAGCCISSNKQTKAFSHCAAHCRMPRRSLKDTNHELTEGADDICSQQPSPKISVHEPDTDDCPEFNEETPTKSPAKRCCKKMKKSEATPDICEAPIKLRPRRARRAEEDDPDWTPNQLAVSNTKKRATRTAAPLQQRPATAEEPQRSTADHHKTSAQEPDVSTAVRQVENNSAQQIMDTQPALPDTAAVAPAVTTHNVASHNPPIRRHGRPRKATRDNNNSDQRPICTSAVQSINETNTIAPATPRQPGRPKKSAIYADISEDADAEWSPSLDELPEKCAHCSGHHATKRCNKVQCQQCSKFHHQDHCPARPCAKCGRRHRTEHCPTSPCAKCGRRHRTEHCPEAICNDCGNPHRSDNHVCIVCHQQHRVNKPCSVGENNALCSRQQSETEYKSKVYKFAQPNLFAEGNKVCSKCNARLFHEESTTCCSSNQIVEALKPLPEDVKKIISTKEFQSNQRHFNNLLAMTALGAARDPEESMWNKDGGMLCLHGKAYHRAFDLGEHNDHEINNTSRMYLYAGTCQDSKGLKPQVQSRLKEVESLITRDNRFIREFVSFMKDVPEEALEDAYFEFAPVSREKNGSVLGDRPMRDEIAAIVFKDDPNEPGKCRRVLAIEKQANNEFRFNFGNNPPVEQATLGLHVTAPPARIRGPSALGAKEHFISIYDPAYEPLQYPLLFWYGESGWGKNWPVRLFMYMRQRLLKEVDRFHIMPMVMQEWLVDQCSRHEEESLMYLRSPSFQKRIAACRTVKTAIAQQQTDGTIPIIGKRLPACHHANPLKKRNDTLDAMAICRRLGDPHLMITMSCNPNWPEIVQSIGTGQTAFMRPDITCRVFDIYKNNLLDDLK